MVYEYEPLGLDRQSFRLLRLIPGKGREIECQLHEYSFAQYLPQYEAVSYTWGSEEKPDHITVDGRPMPVTRNLYELLDCLRHTCKDRTLWIDAVCINQGNPHEQSHQVQRMREIYASAAHVVFWLGAGTPDTKLVMFALAKFKKRIRAAGWSRLDQDQNRLGKLWMELQEDIRRRTSMLSIWERQRNGLRDILTRPWFRRIWVIQEVANARRASVQCGTRSITCQMIVRAPQLYNITPTFHCWSILHAMPTQFRSQGWWTQSRDLYNLLQKFRHAESHLECDKIYALLGICDPDKGMGEIIVDYERPVQQIIKDAISHICFCDQSCLRDSLYPTLDSFLSDLNNLDMRVLSTLLRSTDVESTRAILCRRGNYIHVSPSMFNDAVENQTRGRDLVQLLLDSKRAQLTITEPILISATRNYIEGHKIVELLLQSVKGETITLSQDILVAAAKNPFHASKIMHSLLGYFQQDPVQLTATLTYAIIMNENQRDEIERELMEQRAVQIHVSGDIAARAARSGRDLLKLLSFLDQRGQEMMITEDVLVAAAQNPVAGPTNMSHLLQRKTAKCTKISERVIVSTIENTTCGREVLRALLRHREHEIDINDNILLAIVRDPLWGTDILDIIRSQRGSVYVTKKNIMDSGFLDFEDDNWYFLNSSPARWRPAVDDVGFPILWWSIDNSEEEILRLLVQKGVHVDIGNSLFRASTLGFLPIMQLLLDNKAVLNPTGRNAPLFGAIYEGQQQATQFLLEKGAHMDILDYDGNTPLAVAAMKGDLPIVQLLLHWGAVVDAKSKHDATALMKASENGHLPVVNVLIKNGAFVNRKDKYHFTAFNYATQEGHTDVAQRLLECGARADI